MEPDSTETSLCCPCPPCTTQRVNHWFSLVLARLLYPPGGLIFPQLALIILSTLQLPQDILADLPYQRGIAQETRALHRRIWRYQFRLEWSQLSEAPNLMGNWVGLLRLVLQQFY